MFACRQAAQSAFRAHARLPFPRRPHPPAPSHPPFKTAQAQTSGFSQQSFRRAPQYRYTRYGHASTKNLFQRWAASPYFYHQVGGIALVGGGFYTYNLEAVPVSGRRRFNFISSELEKRISQGQRDQILQENKGRILPDNAPQVRKVRRVLDRYALLDRGYIRWYED